MSSRIFDHCEICGKGRPVGEVHRCSKKFLDRLDAENSRLQRKELDESDDFKDPSDDERLSDGLKQMRDYFE